jgi:capsular exopolysaccharide synthesis family protein
MGDVFDAMNRAKQERGKNEDAEKPVATPADEQEATSDFNGPAVPEEGGGLVYDDVDTQALGDVSKQAPDSSGLAQLDHDEQASSDEQAAPDEQRDDQVTPLTGALPDAPASTPTVFRNPVSAATDRAAEEAQSGYANRLDLSFEETGAAPAQVDRSKLNGYSSEVVVHHDRGSAVTEQYRVIRTQLLARGRNQSIQTTVLTSSTPEEGKSVTTANLGISFSELRNKKTLLVEGDLRRPSFSKLFDRESSPGLLNALRGEVNSIDDAIHPTIYENLQFLPAGGRDSTHSTELLSSPRMAQILEQLKDRYDHIFIDTPPVVTVTDACILGEMADQVLMVVRLNKTPSGAVERAKRLLRAANCDVSGVILTHMRHFVSRYLYKYSYGYGYGYGYTGAK